MSQEPITEQPELLSRRARRRKNAQLSPIEDPEFRVPGQSLWLLDIFNYRELFGLLLKKNTATRYYGSVLGWFWSYIRPTMQFFMYFFVIGIVLGVNRGIELFPIYLFSGLVIVNFFKEALQASTVSITGNGALINKVFLPRELFPVTAVIASFIHFLPQALVLLIVVLIAGWKFSFLSLGLFLLGVIIVMTFVQGLGLAMSALNVTFRDAKSFVDVFLMFAVWSSPVLYSWEMIRQVLPTWLYNVYLINPVTTAVELFHAAFWVPLIDAATVPDDLAMYTIAGLLLAVGTLLVGQLIFRAKEADFAQHL